MNSVFTILVLKMLPLYLIMAAGYFLGRKVKGLGEAVSVLQINIIAPIVIATGIMPLEMQGIYLLLPFIFFALCALISGFLFRLGKSFWNDNTRNILAFAGGAANTGYFGVPVALMLFSPNIVALFLLAMVGFLIFENTLGYYFVARGKHSVEDSLRRLLRLPTLYGCLAGIILSFFSAAAPDNLLPVIRDFRGAYVVLGALMIGFGLSGAKFSNIDFKFLGVLLCNKFILWPLIVLGLIVTDQNILHLFAEDVYPALFLMAIVPLPANAVAFSLLHGVHPEKTAAAVFISTAIALIYIPVALMMMGYI